MLFFIIVFFKPFPGYTGVHSTVGHSVCAAKGSQCKPWAACVQLVLCHSGTLQSLRLWGSVPWFWGKLLKSYSNLFHLFQMSWWSTPGCWCINCTCCRTALKNTGCFSPLQWFYQGQFCFFIVTILLVKDGQSLFKSVERFPLNPDCLLALSWTGSHWYPCWH